MPILLKLAHLIGDGDPFPIRTFRTFDLRLRADSPPPFVDAYRLITGFPGLRALETSGEYIFPSPEQTAEYPAFLLGRECVGYPLRNPLDSNYALLGQMELMKLPLQFFLFGGELLQPSPDLLNPAFYIR